jgi:asparagine synthase (glutamine-hydrolysing)
MCGITGFIDLTNTTERDALERMTTSMLHRGPDAAGCFFLENPENNVGLGHRRLAIIDISPMGHQPMEYEDLVMVYNGEIYNFKELKITLTNLGYTFTGHSDTEVVLKAFHHYGPAAVDHFNGMFAIAIYNKKTSEMHLYRDRIGVKPLYYYHSPNGFVFASELKPIMAYPQFEKKINSRALNLFLFHGYITAPFSIFEGVFKLEPGCFLVYRNNKVEINSYWSLQEKFKERKVQTGSESAILNNLDALVQDAVQSRMVSDVPIGSFLSGGVDSSLVSAVMQSASATPINTFTIGFEEKKYDEANFAKEVANHLKTSHHELYLSIKEAENLVHSLPGFYDEPFADSSQLATMLVSRFAREQVTVVLSGDGGDEFFCGYSRYDTALNNQRIQPIGKIMHALNKVIPLESLIDKIDRRYIKALYCNSMANIINLDYLSTRHDLNGLVKNTEFTTESKYFDITALSDNIQEAHMLQDMITYLPDDICTKVDRATMSVSLEGREPLLDYRIAEFSFSLPHNLKYKDGQKKYLLKELAYRYIPKSLLERPKMGFGVPIYDWLHADLHSLIPEYLNSGYIQKQGIFDPEKIQVLVAKFETGKHKDYFARLIWHLLVFQMWFKEYMD